MLKNIGNGFKTALEAGDIPLPHQTLLNRQRLFYIDANNRCFVHACFDRSLPFTLQKRERFFWDRSLLQDAIEQVNHQGSSQVPKDFYFDADFSCIFTGHTPTTNFGTDQPLRALNIISVDTGAGHSGKLTLLELHEDIHNPQKKLRFWQSDPVTSLYKRSYR